MIRWQYITHVLLALAIAVAAAFPASIAVVLQALWHSMTADLGQSAAIRLIFGAMPTSVYLMAPIACVIAICWLFWVNSQNVTLQVMFAAGMSIVTCALPALLLAATFTGATIVDAWLVAPRGVVMVEDIKHSLRRGVALGALREGKFHTFEFDDGIVSMSFQKKLENDRFEGVFLSVTPKAGNHYSIVSRTASFRKRADALRIQFGRGSRQATEGDGKIVFTTFDSFVRTFAVRGGADRPLTILELGYRKLVGLAFSDDPGHAWAASLARSELAKRVLVPMMNLSHALLAVGLLFFLGPARIRLGSDHLRVALGISAIHVAAVAGIELFARQSFFMHGLLVSVMLAEFAVGVALIARAGRTTREFRLPPVRRPVESSLQDQTPNPG